MKPKPPALKKSNPPAPKKPESLDITPTKTKRVRKLVRATDEKDVKEVLASMIRETYAANKKQNESKKAYDKKRAELFSFMNTHRIAKADVKGDGDHGALQAIVEASEWDVVNVTKLHSKVPLDDFLAVVSASKKAVEDRLGKIVASEVCQRTKGNTNVTVSAVG